MMYTELQKTMNAIVDLLRKEQRGIEDEQIFRSLPNKLRIHTGRALQELVSLGRVNAINKTHWTHYRLNV